MEETQNSVCDTDFIGGISLAIQVIEEYGNIDKIKRFLLKFKESHTKSITGGATVQDLRNHL